MRLSSNPIGRQLSSVPQTHRASTLQAISDKTHATTSRIEYLKEEGKRMREMLNDVPEDTSSRLAWLSRRLQSE